MALVGRHTFGAIDDQRVTFIEKGTNKDRMLFLKELLEHNKFTVVIDEVQPKKEDDPITYTVAVTDMSFNPTIAVYQRRLKTQDGKRVTPDYWNQVEEGLGLKPDYYSRKPKTDNSN